MEHRKQVTDVGEEDRGTRQGERRKTGCWSKEDVIGAELSSGENVNHDREEKNFPA